MIKFAWLAKGKNVLDKQSQLIFQCLSITAEMHLLNMTRHIHGCL